MNIIELLKIALLGILEGITEWLPISSTGHMILLNEWININQSSDFMEMFLVVIQLGAILAVVTIYFNHLNPFSPKKSNKEKTKTWHIWFLVFIGVLPAAILGLLLDDFLSSKLYNAYVVAATLIFYGIIFIVVEKLHKNTSPQIQNISDMTYKTAIFIGIFQTLSLIPGTSRSGATILGGIILGTSRKVAAEFSFFLSIPIMFGASFLKIIKFGFIFTNSELYTLLLGMLIAYIVSIIAIKFLLRYIKTHDFTIFGVYRIILGSLVLLYFLI